MTCLGIVLAAIATGWAWYLACERRWGRVKYPALPEIAYGAWLLAGWTVIAAAALVALVVWT